MKTPKQNPGNSNYKGVNENDPNKGFGKQQTPGTPGSQAPGSVKGQQGQKDQGTSSYGQQTSGEFGQTPEARKGDISEKGVGIGQQDPKERKQEFSSSEKQVGRSSDLDKLNDPDKTKGPERKDIDPVAKQQKGLSTDEGYGEQGLNHEKDMPQK